MEMHIAVRKKKVRKKRVVQYSVGYFFLILFSVIFFFPFYCLFIESVMPDSQLLELPSLWPSAFNFAPYLKVFGYEYLWYFKNTIVVCVLNIIGVCVASSFTAYGIAKVHFKGRNVIFGIILATVLLPGTVTSIPLYVLYTRIGWVGSHLPLWLPVWFGGGAMNIFLVRQFIKGIPNSYTEAAIIDGANSFRIYVSIILPLIKPILVYLAVMTFIGQWNDFQGPLMYVKQNQSSWTMSLALYLNFQSLASGKNLPNVQMAAGVIMLIPCAVLFAFFQKQLMEGVATIGIKG